ncbi:MAG: EamA family transporter [Alphaproteobacteria bacterium]
MIAVFWGLFGALLIGVSDCIARVTAQKTSTTTLFVYIMGLSAIAMTVYFAIVGTWPQVPTGLDDSLIIYGWFAAFCSGILTLVVLFLLYLALARGPVAVASPAASTFTIILIAINAIVGEPFTWMQIVSGVFVFLGVFMLARRNAEDEATASYDAKWIRTTALLGVSVGAMVSIRFFFAQESGDALGSLESLYLNRLFACVGVVIMLGWHLKKANVLIWPSKEMIPFVVMQSVLEVSAIGAFIIGSAGDGRVGATIGFSAFSAVTATAAWIFLGERFGLKRGFWMAVVISGVMLATLSAPVKNELITEIETPIN